MCLEDGPCDARDRWRRKVDGLGLGLRQEVRRGFSPSFHLLSISILSRTCFVFCSGVFSPLVTFVDVGLSAPCLRRKHSGLRRSWQRSRSRIAPFRTGSGCELIIPSGTMRNVGIGAEQSLDSRIDEWRRNENVNSTFSCNVVPIAACL